MKFRCFAYKLSIDEQMVPYFGRHSCKMYMKGKPVRFGFKVWCLCSSQGYLFNSIPYVGKDEAFDKEMGLGAGVVLQLLDVVENPQEHEIYFDNFFTSHKLMIRLNERHFFATGTIREPRLIQSILEDSKKLSKQERGCYSTAFDQVNKIVSVKWFDNAVVTLASNFDFVEPPVPVKRFSRKERQLITVKQPRLISAYNASMGGVDSLDNFVSAYRISVKAKKWWWPYFVNYIDISLTNAWRIHRLIHGNNVSQLDFRRRVALALLSCEDSDEPSETHGGGGGRENPLTGYPDSKLLNSGHIVVHNDDMRRIRCRWCKSNTVYGCSKRRVSLHPKCFAAFHSAKTK